MGFLPEGNGGNPSHESISSDTLQVEQASIEKQQQDDVLTEDEALPTLPDDWDVLEAEQNNHQHQLLVLN